MYLLVQNDDQFIVVDNHNCSLTFVYKYSLLRSKDPVADFPTNKWYGYQD